MKYTGLALAAFAVVLSGCQQASAGSEESKPSDRAAANERRASLQIDYAQAVASQIGRWAVVPTKPNEPAMILDTVTGCVFSVRHREGAPVITEPELEISRVSSCRLGDPVSTVSAN